MDAKELFAQAEVIVDQADYGLLITLANAQYVDRVGGPLYGVTVPQAEQERFGLSLVYEEFLLHAADDLIPASLSTPEGLDCIRRLACERLEKIPIPFDYHFVVQMMLCPSTSPSLSSDNLSLWLKVSKAFGSGDS